MESVKLGSGSTGERGGGKKHVVSQGYCSAMVVSSALDMFIINLHVLLWFSGFPRVIAEIKYLFK